MIQELKRKPILFKGEWGWEVLIKDDEIDTETTWVCERCAYFDLLSVDDRLIDFDIVHDCPDDLQTYYKFDPK